VLVRLECEECSGTGNLCDDCDGDCFEGPNAICMYAREKRDSGGHICDTCKGNGYIEVDIEIGSVGVICDVCERPATDDNPVTFEFSPYSQEINGVDENPKWYCKECYDAEAAEI